MNTLHRSVLTAFIAAVSFCVITVPVCAQKYEAEITTGDRCFTITSPRLATTFEDGMIVELRSLVTHEMHADRSRSDCAMPHGLGHLTGDAAAAAKLHVPWGAHTMNQQIPPGTRFPMMHYPDGNSRYTTTRIANGIRAVWTGLSNGEKTFPNETLTVEARVDPDTGQLLFKGSATSDEGGVYGVQVPLANLDAEHEFYVPTFGGVMYDKNVPPALVTLGGAPFWEAPVIGIQGRQDSLGLWVEDEQFHPNFLFLNWSGKSFAVAIEHLNLMPFGPLKDTDSVTWHLDAFAGGWVDAMTPYKKWYAKTFEPEMKVRDSVAWADRIRIILDEYGATDEDYQEVAANFDPTTVLIHDWNARAPQFDRDLPDWTPRAGYVDKVALAHKHGMKTMAYVNTYCVNCNSPVFERDHLAEFALPRRIRSFFNYTDPRITFDSLKDGQLVYLDPLCARWRNYHTDMMLKWREETGTDANYEDTAGYSGDFGNGVIDRLFGARGTVEQFRELLRRNPSVPMASEYGTDSIAFAVRWPLRVQQSWGNDKTREFWMERMRPVSAYLFGPQHRNWVPTMRAGSNFLRHVVVACSDALGGIAQCPCSYQQLRAQTGVLVHMKQRAQLFSSKQLTPYFVSERCEKDLACMYQDSEGRIYKYYTDARNQKMVGPDGKPVYERVTGQNQVATELALPGWPAPSRTVALRRAGASTKGRLLGLDPAVRYALVPDSGAQTRVQVTGLPEGVKVRRYYETEHFTVLALEPVEGGPTRGTVTLVANARFSQAILNDKPMKIPEWNSAPASITTDFPAYFIFIEDAVAHPKPGEYFGDGHETGRYILVESGLERGSTYEVKLKGAVWNVPGEKGIPPFSYLNIGGDAEVTMDYLVQVPSKVSALQFYVINTQNVYGNGTIGRLYVNGRIAHSYDFGPRPNPSWKEGMDAKLKQLWDRNGHAWRVPVGNMDGQPILVTIATDAKDGDNNADSLWWSRSKFVEDTDQQPLFRQFTDKGPIPEQ